MILLTVAVLAAGAVHERYDAVEATRAPQLLAEAIRFPTFEDNPTMHAAQKQWLLRTAASLGLEGRDAGLVTEIDLPGPPGAPVLGLIVHGDVQPVEEKSWKVPPWTGIVRDGAVWGRGAADDKGPMVQALLAMSALKTAGPARTHTVRLLVGSDEESKNLDLKSYLEKHPAPDLSLVLDSAFPVVVGEKAWDGLTVSADYYNIAVNHVVIADPVVAAHSLNALGSASPFAPRLAETPMILPQCSASPTGSGLCISTPTKACVTSLRIDFCQSGPAGG